jgi:hypothetical protein
MLALTCAGVGTASVILFGQSGRQVRDDYAAVTRHVPLPRGYRWPGADASDTVDGVRAAYAGRNTALMHATLQATCAWWDAWLRATRCGGDARRVGGSRRGDRADPASPPD